MRVLLVTGGFAGPGRQPWLMDELADALAASGHHVDVIVGDAKHGRAPGEQHTADPRVTLFSAGVAKSATSALAKLLGHLTVGFNFHTKAFDWVKKRHYDVCIYTSPASFSWMLPKRLLRAKIVDRTLLFLWDFFPIHQVEIGRVQPAQLAPLLKMIERRAIDGATDVALMSPASVRFYRQYHPGTTNRTMEIPPWSSSKVVTSAAPKSIPLRVLFGGQLAKGRGVETLLAAADLLRERKDEFEFWIAGGGPEREYLEQIARNGALESVRFFGALPRDEYRRLAQGAHVGIAITVAGVSPPSFPSKIVEYCSLALPVIVCVEEASDAGAIVRSQGAGFDVPAGDAQGLADALLEALELHRSERLEVLSAAARQFFVAHLRVENAVKSIEAIASQAEDGL